MPWEPNKASVLVSLDIKNFFDIKKIDIKTVFDVKNIFDINKTS